MLAPLASLNRSKQPMRAVSAVTSKLCRPIHVRCMSTIPIPPLRMGNNLIKYGINLNQQALEGKLDPMIGRNEEVQRAIQVLSRRTKNNPCFIGEPGVGKTAIAEGLAFMICHGNVPDSMKNMVIVSLDLPSMLAGAKFRGEFEERLKGVLKDIEMAGDRIILFIDEIHIIAGTGGSEGAIDAANILKPPLARGLLRCMGATTSDEFRKYIEKDAALARRFQPIFVAEPTVDQTVEILKGLRGKYELYHGVRVSDEALLAACQLSHKYITDRNFPDKAIDLIDEACSKLKIRLDVMPRELQELDTELAALQSAVAALPAGDAAAAQQVLDSVDSSEYVSKKQQRQDLDTLWTSIRGSLGDIKRLKLAVETSELELAKARLDCNHDRVKHIETVELKEKLDELVTLEDKLAANARHSAELTATGQVRLSVKHVLDAAEVASVVAQSTGIPLGSLLETEKLVLLRMEEEMRKRVIGQDDAIRLSRAGLRFHDRPLGVFLMLGSTGVGKTELAKTLSEFLFMDKNSMLRIDMSEFMEKFSVSRLIGAPPGYVGYEEGGSLTEQVRRRPYQVILLDEFEKAHKEVSNLLLQVFDEGRLSDSHGRIVDFRNTVIVLTSNLGTRQFQAGDLSSADPAAVRALVSDHFSPEFVNRLDELTKVGELLKAKNIKMTFDQAVERWLGQSGFDAAFGARPLKRRIQSIVLDPLATLILEGKINDNDSVRVTMQDVDPNVDDAQTSFEKVQQGLSKPTDSDVVFWVVRQIAN